MHLSIPSLLSFFLLLLASSGLGAGVPKRSLGTNVTNTGAIVAINQQISAFDNILDSKDYPSLSLVLTENVHFNLTSPLVSSTLSGTKEIFRALYLNRTTLHSAENVFVLTINATTASVVSDGITHFFGQGSFKGQVANIYDRFYSIFVKEEGVWKLSFRTAVFEVSPLFNRIQWHGPMLILASHRNELEARLFYHEGASVAMPPGHFHVRNSSS